MKSLAALALLAAASISLPAQQCRPGDGPFFDFQVDRPAELLPDSAVSPRPFQPPPGSTDGVSVVVQFIVDTMGRPDSATFKVLINYDPAVAESARRMFQRWRYKPALLASCKVPQLIQTPVRP